MSTNDKPEVIVKVAGVSKEFKLPHEKTGSIKSALISGFRKRRTFERQQALKDISFEVKRGEFFGIVGRNGSGKSTLLKMLAGIYVPTAGTIDVRGHLTPFIELGVGFNPELTGRENVFLNGALLGFDRKQIAAMYPSIVEFAELERFMDQKLKNYSSGMQVRLAFSIAIRAESDILLVDEVLAVGDERFQNKCFEVFEKIKKSDKTIIFISHDMETIKRFCSRVIVLHDSKKIFEGSPEGAASEYVKKNFPETVEKATQEAHKVKIQLKGKDGSRKNVFENGDTATVSVGWVNDKRVKNAGVAIFNHAGQYIFGANTVLDKKSLKKNQVDYTVKLNLGTGRYYAQVGLMGDSDTEKLYFIDKAVEFSVTSPSTWQGSTYLDHEWIT